RHRAGLAGCELRRTAGVEPEVARVGRTERRTQGRRSARQRQLLAWPPLEGVGDGAEVEDGRRQRRGDDRADRRAAGTPAERRQEGAEEREQRGDTHADRGADAAPPTGAKVAGVREPDRLDQAIVGELVPAGAGTLLAADEPPLLERLHRRVL